MTQIRVLFPASPPKEAGRLENASQVLSAEHPDIELQWGRPIKARQPGAPRDYLAGDDAERCDELVRFLCSKTDRIAWFGRGGYGVTRLLSQLAEALPAEFQVENKRWVGYSDITALFSFTKSKNLGIQCVHGPMLCAFHEQPNRDTVIQSLHGKPSSIEVDSPLEGLEFEGSIWGGNLAVLASLAGTDWLARPDSDQAIFLEDVDEPPYRLDRFLTQLSDCGFFLNSKQVFLGTFTGFNPSDLALETILTRCRELGLTVLGHLPIGHSEPHTPLFLDRPYRYESGTQQLVPI